MPGMTFNGHFVDMHEPIHTCDWAALLFSVACLDIMPKDMVITPIVQEKMLAHARKMCFILGLNVEEFDEYINQTEQYE